MKFLGNTNAFAAVLLASVLAACGTSDGVSTAPSGAQGGSSGATAPGASAAGAGSAATATGTQVGQSDMQMPAEPGRGASGEWLGGPQGTLVIYFDYDRSAIREEYSEILLAHGAWLAANPQGRLRLEGHADERGTPEYNLALGSRRANSVAQVLNALGADNDQWTSLSFGEERPAEDAANEAAWSKNRRVELIYE